MKLLQRILRHNSVTLYRNSFYLMTTSVVGAPLGFIFWLVIARLYNDTDVGLAVALISASGLIVNISKFGFDSSIIRFMSKEKDKTAFINTCLTITGIITIVISSIFLLGINIWAQKLEFVTSSILYIFVFVLYTVVSGLYLLQTNIFIAFRDTKYSFLQETIYAVMKIPLPLLFVSVFASFAVFSSWLISATVALVISIFFFTRKVLPSYVPFPLIKIEKIKKIFNFSFANYIIGLLGSSPTFILPLIILNFLTAADSAYFYIAFTIANFLFVIPTAFSTSLFAEGSHNETLFIPNLKKSLKLAFFLLIPCIIGIIVLGKYLLLLFGKNYSSSGYILLVILAITSVFMVLNWSYNTYLRVNFKMTEYFVITLFMSVGVIASSYLFLRLSTLGMTGIGLSYLGVHGIIGGYVSIRFWRLVKNSNKVYID